MFHSDKDNAQRKATQKLSQGQKKVSSIGDKSFCKLSHKMHL